MQSKRKITKSKKSQGGGNRVDGDLRGRMSAAKLNSICAELAENWRWAAISRGQLRKIIARLFVVEGTLSFLESGGVEMAGVVQDIQRQAMNELQKIYDESGAEIIEGIAKRKGISPEQVREIGASACLWRD